MGVWYYLEDNSQVLAIEPTICMPDVDLHCAAYALVPRLFVGQPNVDDHQNTPFLWISYNNPIYIVEFTSGTSLPPTLDDPQDPWAYSVNYTTPTNVSLRMCMGGDSRRSTNSNYIITAGWQYSLGSDSPVGVGNNETDDWDNTLFATQMQIQQANATVVANYFNSSIVEVRDIDQRTNYSVDLGEFFVAFTAPLLDIPAALTPLLNSTTVSDSLCVDSLYDIGSISNASSGADRFVESIVFSMSYDWPTSFTAYPPGQLRGFLAYALGANTQLSPCSGTDNITYRYDVAVPTYSISLSEVSLVGFVVNMAVCFLACLATLTASWMLQAKTGDFPEVLGLLKVDGPLQEFIDDLSQGPWGVAISEFADMKIRLTKAKVGESMTVVLEEYMKAKR
jgi:hypothetical protein